MSGGPPAPTEDGYTPPFTGEPAADAGPGVGARLGDLLLTGFIGQGGMGAVFEARNLRLDRRVAVKVMLPRAVGVAAARQRLLREARNVAALDHPHIVTVYAAGEADGVAYIEMQRVDGVSLDRRMRDGPAQVPEVLGWILQAAEALHHAHSRGVVHRDVKPSNLLLGRDGALKVVDFGISVSVVDPGAAPSSGQIAGTSAFMAPEQWTGRPVDARTDVYALGITLYTLLSGAMPFRGSVSELRSAHLGLGVPSVRLLRPDAPAALDAILRRATAKRPADRYPTAEALSAALAALLPDTPSPLPGPEVSNPYRGLLAFDRSDGGLFFGRDRVIDHLERAFAALLDPAEAPVRLLTVLGPSGTGKSSLVRAGLLPRLEARRDDHATLDSGVAEASPVDPRWHGLRVVVMTPGAHPRTRLADALTPLVRVAAAPDGGGARAFDALRAADGGPDALHHFAADALKPGEHLVVVVDQFEEVFTLSEAADLRAGFVELLLGAAADVAGRVSVILTLRSDALAATQAHPGLNRLIAERAVVVPVMSEVDLRQAIAAPARHRGYVLPAGLVEGLLHQTVGREGALPLLQHTLMCLWDGMRAGRQPDVTLRALGGVGGALAASAEATYTALEEAERGWCRRAFQGLARWGDDGRPSRRRVEVHSLLARGEAEEPLLTLLRRFADPQVRLITLSQPPGAAVCAEVSHEALFEHWLRLRGWLEEGRVALALAQEAESAAREWVAEGRNEGLLWRAPKLGRLQDLAAQAPLPGPSMDFLEAGLALARREVAQLEERQRAREGVERAREQERRTLRRALAAVSVALGVAVVGFVSAVGASREARVSALVFASEASSEKDAMLALILAREAAALERSERTRSRLQQALAQSLERAAIETSTQLTAFQVSRAVDQMALGGQTGDVFLGPLRGPLRRVPQVFSTGISALVFAPDERSVWVSSRRSPILKRLDLEGRLVDQVTAPVPSVCSWDVHPDGRHLIYAGCEGGAGVLDLSGGAPLILREDARRLLVQYRPDGGAAALCSEGRDLEVLHFGGAAVERFGWQAPAGSTIGACEWRGEAELVVVLSGQARGVTLLDDRGVLRARVDGVVRGTRVVSAAGRFVVRRGGGQLGILDSDGQLLRAVQLGSSDLSWVKWSRVGERLAVLLNDGSISVVAADGDAEPIRLPGGGSTGFEFVDDAGERVISVAGDRGVRVWVTTPSVVGEPQRLHARGRHCRFSPVEPLLACSDIRGGVHLTRTTGEVVTDFPAYPEGRLLPSWEAGRARRGIYAGIRGSAYELDWSPDGALLATSSDYGLVRIWERATGRLTELEGHAHLVRSVRWQPGRAVPRLLSVSDDGSARLWSREGAPLAVLWGHDGLVLGAEWSPRGDRLVTYGPDGRALVWSETGERLFELPSAEQGVTGVAWTPDGDVLATGTVGGILRLWSDEGAPLGRVDLGANIADLEWSPDGRRLVVGAVPGSGGSLWIVGRDGQVLRPLPGHTAQIRNVGWRPDGSLIATASSDGTTRLWTPEGEPHAVLVSDGSLVWPMDFSHDGRHLATSRSDGTTLIWPVEDADLFDLAAQRITRGLLPQEQEQFGEVRDWRVASPP